MSEKLLQQELNDFNSAFHELQIKEERYRLIAEHVRDVIWTMKLDGTITYISPAVEAVRGLTVEEAMNQELHEIITPESIAKVGGYMQEQYLAYISGEALSSFKGEVDYYKKDGSILHTEVLTYPILGKDFDSTLILGVTRDITERKEFESQILEQSKKLLELNATKDKFFSIIAHDLKNPIRSILGFSELLKSEVSQGENESLIAYADILYFSSKQTVELLENLLDWAKSQQNSFPFSPDPLVVNNLIASEINNLKTIAEQKNILLTDETEGQIALNADEKMISTVIRNLISNAIKFTPVNGGISVKSSLKTDRVEVSVSDTGTGISEQNKAKLFQLLNGFTTRGTENEKGSGLGLVLCKEFVEKHKGSIWVESEWGKGSRFTFSIPTTLE
jgi:PAS domain S-box-containing protein